MASRQSTSKAHRDRERTSSSRRARSTPPERARAVEQSEPEILDQICNVIENERRELMRVDAVLGCLAVSLVHTDEEDEIPPFHTDVADVARRLVRDSAYRLNSLDVDSLPKRIQDAKAHATKQKRPNNAGRKRRVS